MDDPIITIDGKDYKYSELPQGVQSAVSMFNDWSNQLIEAKTNVVKLELAIGGIGNKISEMMRNQSKEPAVQVKQPPTE